MEVVRQCLSPDNVYHSIFVSHRTFLSDHLDMRSTGPKSRCSSGEGLRPGREEVHEHEKVPGRGWVGV